VPYTAAPPAILAFINGTIQMFFGNISDIVGPVGTGKVTKCRPRFSPAPTR
jgi:tripartite-type tricarboxylate transporter receptor subunit TctC